MTQKTPIYPSVEDQERRKNLLRIEEGLSRLGPKLDAAEKNFIPSLHDSHIVTVVRNTIAVLEREKDLPEELIHDLVWLQRFLSPQPQIAGQFAGIARRIAHYVAHNQIGEVKYHEDQPVENHIYLSEEDVKNSNGDLDLSDEGIKNLHVLVTEAANGKSTE